MTRLRVCIDVPDLDRAVAFYSDAFGLGATLEAGPVDQPFGRIAQLADPFGHGLCILQMSERGYDTAPGQT